MNLNRMAVFAAIVERGSFTAAAAALGLTKSMVSKNVAALEDELGVRLMERTTRRLALTEAGQVYYRGCQAVADEAAALSLRLQQLKHEPQGTLRVTTTVDFAAHPLAGRVAAFTQLYPKVRVELWARDGLVDLVKENVDVAIRLGWLRDSSLMANKLATLDQALVASPAYLARSKPVRQPSDLLDHACIALTLLRRPRRWVVTDAAGRVHELDVDGRVSADSPTVVNALAMAGAGVAMLGLHIVGPALREGRLVRLLPACTMPEGGIYAVTPSRRALAPKVRAFLEFVRTPAA